MGEGYPRILILAGETSGDQYGARVAESLKKLWPKCCLVGIGGDAMKSKGVHLLEDLEKLAVMGFYEIMVHVPFFYRLKRRVRKLLDNGSIDLVIPIDYPGFNLSVVRMAKKLDIRVLYYITPKVWAWRPSRAKQLAKNCDHLAVIFPFEADFFQKVGAKVEVTFVGHPLLDEVIPEPDRYRFCQFWGFDPAKPILALFPGSRLQELIQHRELFLATGRCLKNENPDIQIAWAKAGSVSDSVFRGSEFPVISDTQSLLAHARVALVKSGTTTLEATLQSTPFVTVYRTHPLTYLLARLLVNVDYIALPNLLMEKEVVPEVLQGSARPGHLANLLGPLFDMESDVRIRMIKNLNLIRGLLGNPGASERVASLAKFVLEKKDDNL
tara:strand:- start:2020 stop:3168 length:1149 start_codon:yes stop_codon:yes gene_type:complete